jgi:hypothetical protein
MPSGYSTPQSGSRPSDDITRPLTAPDPDDITEFEDPGFDSDDAELLAAEAHVGSGGGMLREARRDGDSSGGTM